MNKKATRARSYEKRLFKYYLDLKMQAFREKGMHMGIHACSASQTHNICATSEMLETPEKEAEYLRQAVQSGSAARVWEEYDFDMLS
jgi:hypothetical protein